MEAFFFGKENKKLFGVYHQANRKKLKDIGVVLCYPFGQEYIRCHLAYFELAKKLANNGFHTFRFDYNGTGDSEDSKDNSLEKWIDDIHTAVSEVREGCDIKKICLIGLRLGASLSLIYSGKYNIDSLILWSPIINGIDYLQELKVIHHFYVKNWLNRSFDKLYKNDDNSFESLGFLISENLFQEISKINLIDQNLNSKVKVLLLDDANDISTNNLINHFDDVDIHYEFNELINGKFWLKEGDEMGKCSVPISEIAVILNWLERINEQYR